MQRLCCIEKSDTGGCCCIIHAVSMCEGLTVHVDWMLVGELASLFKLYRQDSIIYDVIGIASCLIRWYIHQRAENHWTLSCCSNFVMNDGALFFCLKYSL